MDEVESELRGRLLGAAKTVRDVVDSRPDAAGQPGGVRVALRNAVQRRETAQLDLDTYLSRRRAAAPPG